MAAAEGPQVAINILNKVMKYAVGLGVTASVLQTALYNGEWHAHRLLLWPWLLVCVHLESTDRATTSRLVNPTAAVRTSLPAGSHRC